MKRWGVLVGAAVLTLAFVAPAPSQGPVRLTSGKIVIAVLNDQSGVYKDLSGPTSVEAVRMAVADFEQQFGKFPGPVEIISADHQNKPDLANVKAREFYERYGANIILDVPTSSAALAVAEAAKELKRLYINITAATTQLTNDNCNKYTFHYAYDTYMLANGTATEVTKKIGKNWYIVYPNYAFGQDMERSFRAAIERSGGKVLLSDGTPFPNDDFSTYLIKARTLRPTMHVLGVMQAGGDLVNFVKQYNEFGLRSMGVNLAIGLLFLSDVHALGVQAFEGTLYTTPWEWVLDKQSREWADRFLARTKVRPTFAHAGNYSATWQYLSAVRRAGTDQPDAVVAALEGFRFSDFFARNAEIRRQDHRVIHDAYLARVKAAGEVKEPWDYVEILSTIPAGEAFQPLSASKCKM